MMQSALTSHRRPLLCLALSVLLHVAVLGYSGIERILAFGTVKNTPALLQVRLQSALPMVETKVDQAAEPILKDTLTPDEPVFQPAPPPAEHPPARPDPKSAAPPQSFAAQKRVAQRKLSEHLFYPPEAVEQGLEGEVRVLLALDSKGNVLDAEVASSSGHVILDRAAVRAAYATGRLPDAGVRELILPVVFRLQ